MRPLHTKEGTKTGETKMRRALLPVVIALVVVLPFAAGVPTASAIVTTWDYTVNAGFSAFAPGSVIASQPGTLCSGASCPPSTFYNTRLEWGTPTPEGGNLRSALQLTEPASSLPGPPVPPILGGPIVTDNGVQPGINITHENRVVLDNGNTLSTATIAGRLTLAPKTPPGPPFAFDTNFSIRFKETLNVGPCLGGTSVCDDIFVLDQIQNPFGTFQPTGPLVFPFSFGADNYTLTLTLNGLGPLTAAQCAAAGAAAGCLGFLTPEGLNTTLTTSLSIQSVNPIPEPSTLLLLGTGLAALSLYTRKKAKQRAV
jgi:hypothetical protein